MNVLVTLDHLASTYPLLCENGDSSTKVFSSFEITHRWCLVCTLITVGLCHRTKEAPQAIEVLRTGSAGVPTGKKAKAEVLPLSWYDVLLALAEAPNRQLRMNELAAAIVLSRSGLTRLVDRLEAAGLLCRQPTPNDRRGSYAVLTADGLEALRKTWPVYAKGITEHFARYLSDEEAHILTDVFQRLLTAVRDT